ncbi:MAG TPA: GNAT family N-acetyltransferase [Bryobacteraceae bacterium]|nr:GNAT family N-acetyltransferase [Bryobacteraceae bacterium]
MAAAPELHAAEIVDLSRVTVEDLEPVLEEERITWRSTLRWDFGSSAELVRRFVRIQALGGFALLIGGRVVGYTYYVVEDRKGLIGDLYILREFACSEYEDTLLSAVLEALVLAPGVNRIEAQLMMMRGPFERTLPLSTYSKIHPRLFMLADLADVPVLAEGKAAQDFRYRHWSEARQEESAALIAAAYKGHVDATINDQYSSVSGARRFIHNIVQYPGCGSFFLPASLIADRPDGGMAGVILGSLVAGDTGHVTQVCVAPLHKGQGVGYELMRRSLSVFAQNECERVSLTVTAGNTEAIELYQRIGFRATRRFAAYVWEGF